MEHINKAIELAKKSLVPPPKEFGRRPEHGCSRSPLVPCAEPPFKEIYGSKDQEFFFDKYTAIRLCGKLFVNVAEGIVLQTFKIPNIYMFFKENSHLDLETLIEKYIPILAVHSFLDEYEKTLELYNKEYCYKIISKDDVSNLGEIIKKSFEAKFRGIISLDAKGDIIDFDYSSIRNSAIEICRSFQNAHGEDDFLKDKSIKKTPTSK